MGSSRPETEILGSFEESKKPWVYHDTALALSIELTDSSLLGMGAFGEPLDISEVLDHRLYRLLG